jgi:hypothetical protein
MTCLLRNSSEEIESILSGSIELHTGLAMSIKIHGELKGIAVGLSFPLISKQPTQPLRSRPAL